MFPETKGLVSQVRYSRMAGELRRCDGILPRYNKITFFTRQAWAAGTVVWGCVTWQVSKIQLSREKDPENQARGGEVTTCKKKVIGYEYKTRHEKVAGRAQSHMFKPGAVPWDG